MVPNPGGKNSTSQLKIKVRELGSLHFATAASGTRLQPFPAEGHGPDGLIRRIGFGQPVKDSGNLRGARRDDTSGKGHVPLCMETGRRAVVTDKIDGFLDTFVQCDGLV